MTKVRLARPYGYCRDDYPKGEIDYDLMAEIRAEFHLKHPYAMIEEDDYSEESGPG